MIPDRNTQSLLRKFTGKRILVIGDLVLDHYLDGAVSRISPEAPVPVVTLGDNCERWIPGGAANVALNVLSLGGLPVIAGVTGADHEGEILTKLLEEASVNVDAVIQDSGRPTTVKTRVMGRNQQLIRIDREKTHFLTPDIESELKSAIDSVMTGVDAVILEDYDKGVLTPGIVKYILSEARERELFVAVDPKNRGFWNYKGCSIFKPNRHEAAHALGAEINGKDKAISSAVDILKQLGAEAVLITLGSNGSVLVREASDSPLHFPTVARHVYDVSGAGDSVIAVLGLAGGSGVSMADAAELANLAAAAACSEPGVYAVKPADILREARRFE